MKPIKNHFILLLVAGLFSLTSCSNDDESTEERSVNGTWELESTNPQIPGLNPDACPERPQITFNEDGTTDWIFYSKDNNCEAQSSSGTWNKTSATNYSITIPDQGTFEGTVNFESSQKFTFSTSYQYDASTSIPVQLTFEKS